MFRRRLLKELGELELDVLFDTRKNKKKMTPKETVEMYDELSIHYINKIKEMENEST